MTSYGMTWYDTVAWNNPPLGSGFSGIVFDGLDMYHEWTIPACRNSFYGQNVQFVGAVLVMRQGSNGKIRSLPTWQLIYPNAFTVTPWWIPPAWARCMVGVTVRHHRHQPTLWPTKRAHTSRCLERRWISAYPIQSAKYTSSDQRCCKYQSHKYKYKYKYLTLKYKYKYKYSGHKYKYKYKYLKLTIKYNPSTGTHYS